MPPLPNSPKHELPTVPHLGGRVRGGCLSPEGEGGLHVFRLEGPGTQTVLQQIFPSFAPKIRQSTRLLHGLLKDGEEDLDDVLVAVAPNGQSAEISTHGARALRSEVLALFDRLGVELVSPQELTLVGAGRAIQQEANDLLKNSFSIQGMLFALRALEGDLICELRSLLKTLDRLDGAVVGSASEVTLRLLGQRLESLLGRCDFGRAFGEHQTVLLIGPPNAGKSSLANRLSGRDRCIVTKEAGTTRDVVRVPVAIGGYPFALFDSAGLRGKEASVVEGLGMEQALAQAARTDHIVMVLDSQDPSPLAEGLLTFSKDPRTLVVLNKCDLGAPIRSEHTAAFRGRPQFVASALSGAGIEAIVEAIIFRSAFKGPATRDVPVPFTQRQEIVLSKACASVADSDPKAAAGYLTQLLEGPL